MTTSCSGVTREPGSLISVRSSKSMACPSRLTGSVVSSWIACSSDSGPRTATVDGETSIALTTAPAAGSPLNTARTGRTSVTSSSSSIEIELGSIATTSIPWGRVTASGSSRTCCGPLTAPLRSTTWVTMKRLTFSIRLRGPRMVTTTLSGALSTTRLAGRSRHCSGISSRCSVKRSR